MPKAKAPGPDTVMEAVRWIREEPWLTIWDELVDAHFGHVLDILQIDPDGLEARLGAPAIANLYAMVGEDLLAQPSEDPDADGFADTYLAGHGWKLSGPDKRYIEAIAETHLGIFRLTALGADGRASLLPLLEAKADAVDVTADPSLGKNAQVGDHFALRVIEFLGKTRISGPVLPLAAPLADALVARFRDDCATAIAEMMEMREDLPVDAENEAQMIMLPLAAEYAVHMTFPSMITRSWLWHSLTTGAEPLTPRPINWDGHPARFLSLEQAEPTDDPDGLAEALDGVSALVRVRDDEDPDMIAWDWVAPPGDIDALDSAPVGPVDMPEPEAEDWLRGTVDLVDGCLRLSVNSEERAQSGWALLDAAAGGILGTPVREETPLTEILHIVTVA